MRLARTAVAALVASTSLIAATPANPASAVITPEDTIFISEFHYDNSGTDTGEAIEITGPAGTDLAGWSIVLYNGSGGAVYNTSSLTGVLPDLGAGFGTIVVSYPVNGIQNGSPDGIALVDSGGVVRQFLSYEGTFTAVGGPADGMTSTDIGVSEPGTTPVGDSLQLTGTGACSYGDLTWTGPSPNTFGSVPAGCGAVGVSPVINEFSASTTGIDVEYVEVKGTPDTDLSAYTVLEIEGDGSGAGTVDEVIAVGTTDASGYYLANLPANALENGTITLLLVENFTGAVNQDLDTDNDGTFDVTPWDSIVDDIAVNDGGSGDVTYAVTLGVSYDGLPFAPGGASRIPDGVDTDTTGDWVRNDFDLAGIPGNAGTPVIGEAFNTPGAVNEAVTVPPGTPYPIHAVQGEGDVSPLEGQRVIVDGVVTADFQGSGQLGGFYVQEPDADVDLDPLTSEGIFVFSSSPVAVAVGDFVAVTGTATEFNGLTEVASVTDVVVVSAGNPLPAVTTVSLPATAADREAVEGMLVTYPQALTISEFFNFDRFGEIVLTTDRQFQPTAVFEPGSSEAAALAADHQLNRITLDDGRSAQNPDPAIHPNGLEFTLDNRFRGGDLVTDVTGVMDFRFGLYRIQPTEGANYTPVNERTAGPDAVGGNLKVASFNVLNYFNTIDEGRDAWICGPDLDQECRGADNDAERVRQLAKIVAAIDVIDADVLGIIEVENTAGVEAMADIVAGLNTIAGFDKYAYVDTGVIGTDAIKVGLIYQPASADPVGNFAILDSSVDPRFLDSKNRPVLAQTFMDNDTGGLVTVAVNHLKSKGSDCNDVGDPDLGDGAGNCNVTRTLAAEALVDWLATDPTGSGSANRLIIGDLNSYDQEDPIDAILVGGYTDLVAEFGDELAYSYVFDGQLGYLDHALASDELVGDVTGTTVWHINADEPDILDYTTRFKQDAQDALYEPNAYRSSDHDPVIVGLDVCDAIAPELEVSLDKTVLWPPNHQMETVTATVTATDNFDASVTPVLVSVTSNEPDDGLGDGDTAGDIVIVDDTTFELRAERSGVGEGRVYTVTYSVTDSCGNTTVESATVFVPLSQGRVMR